METTTDFAACTRLIRENEIGRWARIETPFGRRLLAYADLTATGRYLRFVEQWIAAARPFYANTHTQVSTTGALFTRLRESAREQIRRSVHAAEDDQVVFCGSGATCAVNKLVGLLGLRIPDVLERRYALSRHIPPGERPVVFVGPYEHHSNLLPWVESVVDVVEIGLDDKGRISLDDLEEKLRGHADRPRKIGSFSAASNVTGVLTDVHALARVLHRHGARAFFDYAAAAPYVPIRMRTADPEERLDAIFLSPHKFVGGPGASGVLIAGRDLFENAVPERPGGGTVSYVAGPARDEVDYIVRPDEREEGGTPAIIGDLRAAAAFLVKDLVGPEAILEHETRLADQATERLSRNPRIRILGPSDVPRLAIVSFTVEDLHHDLVSVLLDHLFGIQNRAGCTCAGPYGHALLGIDLTTSHRYRALIRRGIEGIKPGWVRLSLPYYASPEDIDYILTAAEFVADHGMEFVPLYRMNWRDGAWRHVERPSAGVAGLDLTLEALLKGDAGDRETLSDRPLSAEHLRAERKRYLDEARRFAHELHRRWEAEPPRWNRPTGDPELDELVWFRYVHTSGKGDIAGFRT